MNISVSVLLAITAFAVPGIFGSAQSFGQNAYIANAFSNNVSVIDTQTNTVIGSPIPVGNFPWGVAVSPDGGKVYVTVINGTERTSGVSGGVAVIDTRTNTVIATFPAGNDPTDVAVGPNGGRLYVANDNLAASTVTVIDAATGATIATIPTGNGNATAGVTVSPDGTKVYAVNLSTGEDAVSVIDAATNAVVATISTPGKWNAYQAAFSPAAFSPDGTRAYLSESFIGQGPVLTVIDFATSAVVDTILLGIAPNLVDAADGVVVSPDGKRVYVVNDLLPSGQSFFYSQVSVIDTATDLIVAAIPIAASASAGISITPDGTKIYVINTDANSVTVIDAATNATTAVIPVGSFPISDGNFIQPAPRFAGTPGKPNCIGVGVAALVRQYGGLNAAAATLGLPRVPALQNAIMGFCEGNEMTRARKNAATGRPRASTKLLEP
jgi:YVTN family beta-propeller protein